MGTPAPLTETPYSSLSDEQLIELLPASDEEKYLDRATTADEEMFEEDPERFIKSAFKGKEKLKQKVLLDNPARYFKLDLTKEITPTPAAA